MQIETQSFQLPQYESALLKKQRQSKVLSPKVTHIYPEIKQIQKIKIKRHHLDDTDMKNVLQYDYEDNPQPKQYLFRGTKLEYDRNDYKRSAKSPSNNRLSNTGFTQNGPANLKLNTEYFESQPHFNQFTKPERDTTNQQTVNHPTYDPNLQKFYQTESMQPSNRLKKSVSVTDFESLRRDQQEMSQTVINRITMLENQTERLGEHLVNTRQQKSSAHAQPLIARYKSETKRSSVDKDFNKLKEKLERERTKEKQRLELQLQKIKLESKRIREEEKRRKKSFKLIVQKQQNQGCNGNKYLVENLAIASSNPHNQMHATSLRTATTNTNQTTQQYKYHLQTQNNMIGQKLNELERKCMPKTNIVNKRIQCEIYDPKTDHLKRLQDKPRFLFNEDTDTDSQFSDY